MKNTLFIVIAVALLVGGGSFYGGMKYVQSGTAQRGGAVNSGNFANLSPEERQQRFQQMGASGNAAQAGRQGGARANGGFASGEIISKDAASITVKLQDGGSKIVFFSDNTEISKSVSGSAGDLTTGKTVMVTGKANDDGSVVAESIQLRPVPSPRP